MKEYNMDHIEIILDVAAQVNDGKMTEKAGVQFLINNCDKEDIYRCYMGSDTSFEKITDDDNDIAGWAWDLVEEAANQLEL